MDSLIEDEIKRLRVSGGRNSIQTSQNSINQDISRSTLNPPAGGSHDRLNFASQQYTPRLNDMIHQSHYSMNPSYEQGQRSLTTSYSVRNSEVEKNNVRFQLPPPELTSSVEHSMPSASRKASNNGIRDVSKEFSKTDVMKSSAPAGSAKRKEELEMKEKAVRNALKQKQLSLIEETRRLAAVDYQLQVVRKEHQDSINELRRQLEISEKSVSALEKDAKYKKIRYEAAKTALEIGMAEKTEITAKLTALILETEQLRENKLNQLMLKIEHTQGGSTLNSKESFEL